MLTERLRELVMACFTGIWIESHEHEDALAEIAKLCREEENNWRLATWDIDAGLQVDGRSVDTAPDPLAAIRSAAALGIEDGTAILILKNLHRFLQSPEIVQAIARQVVTGKRSRVIVVVLAPVVQLQPELEKLFVVLEHDLPDHEQLEVIARGVANQKDEVPTGQDLTRLLDASAGLTRLEAENAYSLSLVREGKLTAETVFEIKSQGLKKSGLLSIHRGTEDFSCLGGLSALKTFCKRSLLQAHSGNPLKRPRGVMLLGVSGTGKSAFAKALGNETGRPTLALDIGALMGSLVGQTEQNIRQALKLVDAMSPSVVFVDEVDKALAGISSGGDSGVSARLFGTLLTWMNDKQSDSYLVTTANDVSRLPPEFTRAERFDGIFFLNLPGSDEREAIWQLYLRHFQLDAKQKRPDDTNWTGAEVRACCRLAALLDLPLVQAAQNVVPVAVTAAESVDRLKAWASGRCLDANKPGIYFKDGSGSSQRRKITRADSANN